MYASRGANTAAVAHLTAFEQLLRLALPLSHLILPRKVPLAPEGARGWTGTGMHIKHIGV